MLSPACHAHAGRDQAIALRLTRTSFPARPRWSPSAVILTGVGATVLKRRGLLLRRLLDPGTPLPPEDRRARRTPSRRGPVVMESTMSNQPGDPRESEESSAIENPADVLWSSRHP